MQLLRRCCRRPAFPPRLRPRPGAGPEARGQGHYYTVTGPSGLIEYDNTQAGANHIHAVWREWTGDWGDDLLAAHYAASHHGEMSLPKLRK